MTKIVIVFDAEDFLSPQTPDMQLWWAEEISSRGLTASFQMVGEMTRKLLREGRHDVIEAIKKHDIGYHTNLHSVHPTHPEGTENMSLPEAVAWVKGREAQGIQDVSSIFQKPLLSYTSPGISWTPATLLANAANGIQMAFCVKNYKHTYNPFWYCGNLIVQYGVGFESSFGEMDIDCFKRQFDAIQHKAQMEENAVFAIYSHPGRLATAQHWDIAYANGKNPSIHVAKPPPLWGKNALEKHKNRVCELLDWVQSRSDIEISSVSQIWQKYNNRNKKDLSALLETANLPNGQEGYLPLKPRSNSDDFYGESMEYSYKWVPHVAGFNPEKIFQQAEGLAWTTKEL